MAHVNLEETSKPTQDLYNRAFAAFERGNLDYSIDLFTSVLKQEPRLLSARRYLRAAELKKRKGSSTGAAAAQVTLLLSLPAYIKATLLASSKNPVKGVEAAEVLLKKDPLHPAFAQVFARAAHAADMPEAAIQTLEVVLEHHPNDIGVVKRLGSLLAEVGETRKARQAYERLAELNPRDPDVQKLLKDSIAIDSMAQDG
ncbi:MAG: tetratricopeptide repeat protein, partial [Nitrospinaceae bacterium]|nr:tetratricopeptide repeat protein [Nitrospinaceae bacterium]